MTVQPLHSRSTAVDPCRKFLTKKICSDLSLCTRTLTFLASRAVVGNILLERFQFTAQIIYAPLQQIADGKNSQ